MTVYIWGRAERYGNYQRAVETAGGSVQFTGDPERCDALLLPGGGDLEPWRYGQENIASREMDPDRDAAELKLLDHFTSRRKPVLGICRGLQMINVYFGGTLTQDISGHSAVEGMDRYHYIRTDPSSPLAISCEEAGIVNSAHHQAVDRLGAGLKAVQWANDGTIEALCHYSLPVWAVQWHPERLGGVRANKLFDTFLALQ